MKSFIQKNELRGLKLRNSKLLADSRSSSSLEGYTHIFNRLTKEENKEGLKHIDEDLFVSEALAKKIQRCLSMNSLISMNSIGFRKYLRQKAYIKLFVQQLEPPPLQRKD
jgi:hypothetical protein